MFKKVPIERKVKSEAYSKKLHDGGQFRRQSGPLQCEFYSPILKKWESFSLANNKVKKSTEG